MCFTGAQPGYHDYLRQRVKGCELDLIQQNVFDAGLFKPCFVAYLRVFKSAFKQHLTKSLSKRIRSFGKYLVRLPKRNACLPNFAPGQRSLFEVLQSAISCFGHEVHH